MYTDFFSHFSVIPKKKPSAHQLRQQAERFLKVETVEALAQNLNIPLAQLRECADKPKYFQFHLPKPNGEQRLIESADKPLRQVQKHLQQRLQAVYYTIRPDCAYGGVISPSDEALVRTIYTNAMQHVGKKWLLNFDLKDFFPNIRRQRVFEMLIASPFRFPDALAQHLSQLLTHEDHLPQGASTSPIIANLVFRAADLQLEALAREKGWHYTRYIDDMAFSGKKRFKDKHIKAIQTILEQEGFVVNLHKIAVNRIHKDQPLITGLVIKNDKPDVSDQFLRDLQGEVAIYKALVANPLSTAQAFTAQTLQHFKEQVLGKLNFLRFVRGDQHKSYLKLQAEVGG